MRVWLSVVIGLMVFGTIPLRSGDAQGVLDRLEKAVDQIAGPDASGTQASNPTFGYLGLTASEQKGATPGLLVTRVVPNGPAALAGIRVGDQIFSVNGRRVQSLKDMNSLVQRPPGTRLTFEIRRGNTIAKGDVTLAVRPNRPAGAPTIDELPPPPPPNNGPTVTTPRSTPNASQHASLGVNVIDVTPASRKRYHLTVRRGAVIRTIHPGSAAAKSGLPLGGAIVAIDGQVIQSADDVVAVIQAHKPGDMIDITYYDGDRMARRKVQLGHGGPAAASAVNSPHMPPPKLAPRAPAPPPTPEPALRLGGSGRDRPLLRRLGQAPDTLVPPASPSSELPPAKAPQPRATAPDASTPPAEFTASDIAALQREVKTLRKQLQTLQQRLDQLEQQVSGKAAEKNP